MGIFYDHGVVYLAVLADGSRTVIADTAATDGRLLQSQFYRSRQADWGGSFNTFDRRIEEHEGIDVALTDAEEALLRQVINTHTVASHGWWEIYSMGTSYG